MSGLLDAFCQEYDRLYDSEDRVSGYREAVAWFDAHQEDPGVVEHRNALIHERQDLLSSDREAAAFVFAYRRLRPGPES